MGIRVTVVLEEVNAEKLRNIQAKLIKNSTKSISFSYVLNQVVADGLKKLKKKKKLIIKTSFNN